MGNPQDRWLRPYWALDYTQGLLISRAKLSSALLWANEQSPLRGARGQGERARTDAAGGSASYSLTYELLYLGAVQGAAPHMLR